MIATARLTARVLCKRHNEALSDLETNALDLVRIADQIDEGFNAGTDTEFAVNGDQLEGWMLKTLCGHLASENMVNQSGEQIAGWNPPRQWLEILFRGHSFPDGYGLYLPRGNAGKVEEITRELLRFTPLWSWDQKTSIGMRMWLFEDEYVLAMHESVRCSTERLLDDAIYRPACIRYQDPKSMKRLNFQWSTPAQQETLEIRRLPLIGR
jgi:hypothetical protein